MNYSREQLEEMSDIDLDITAYAVSDYQLPSTEPSTNHKDAMWLQDMAIDRDTERYVNELAHVTDAYAFWDGCEGNMAPEGIVWMLKASPRERTIAAVLTLQGQGGTGDE